MNDQQKQDALNHLQRHWGNKPCPCCGHNSWNLNDKLAMMPNVDDKSINMGSGYAFFVGECRNCSYSLFFNAVTSGIK